MKKTEIRALLMSLFFSILLIVLLGNKNYSVMGIEFNTSVAISQHGVTEIMIPPVGSITAETHRSPVKIRLMLQSINTDTLQELILAAPTSTELTGEIIQDLRYAARDYVLHLILLSMLGGVLGAILVCGRQFKPAISGAICGLVLCLLLVGVTYKTYEIDKLRSPEYHGVLKAAPWAIDMAEKAFQKFNRLGEQMRLIAANLYNIFEQIDKIKPIEEKEEDLLVAHVSDIHNNPAAHDFILQIVENFPVDLVIDTGDITDYGTPIESRLLTGLMDLKIPYLFVPGNHDSPQTIKDLSSYPQVQVLTGGIVDVQGLRIAAIADPSSWTGNTIATADQALIKETEMKLLSIWQDAENNPNMVAVHDFRLAERLVGRVPLILFGHTHQVAIKEEKGSILINPGTTGGAGIRGLQATKEIPYSLVLLHFVRNENNDLVLVATDTIKLYNLEKGFILERNHFLD